MKKALIFLGILTTIVFGISLNQVFGSDSTTELITSSDETSMYTMVFEDENYAYSDYQELISQIYDDIYEDVYDQIYSEVISDLNDGIYEAIYASVNEQLEALLEEQEISVYLGGFQNDIYDVLELAEHSVYGVTSYLNDDNISVGSGVVYKYDEPADLYYLITNYHVIEDSQLLEIRFEDGTSVEVEALGYDTEVDIAILTFSGENLDKEIIVSTLADSSDYKTSDFVLAVGNPKGYDFYRSATIGIVSGLDREVDSNRYVKFIQHDAAINGGNSGGPLYNLDGEVIGINASKLADISIEGLGFAIPIDIVKEIIDKVEGSGLEYNTIMPRISAEFLVVEDEIEGESIYFESYTYNDIQLLEYTLNLPTGVTSGLLVDSILEAGTLDGKCAQLDLVYKIDNYLITDYDSFIDYIYENYQAGDVCTIHYYEFNAEIEAYSDVLSTIQVEFK